MATKNLIKLGFLDASRTAFLACDLQEAFRKSMKNFDVIVQVANRMTAVAGLMDIPVYVSEHYPKGLGHITKDFSASGAALVYDKTKFSMATPKLMNALNERFPNKLDAVVLFGIETHACVEQTAMDLLSQDIAVHVVADGCLSRTPTDRMIALQRMRDIGCHVTTSESVMFKLMKDKDHPKFKEMSKLIRETIPDTMGYDTQSKL